MDELQPMLEATLSVLPTYVRQIKDTAISVKSANNTDQIWLKQIGFYDAPHDELRSDLILDIVSDEDRATLFAQFQQRDIAFATAGDGVLKLNFCA